MGEVPGCIHEGVVIWRYSLRAEDVGVTMLLTVGATKFRAFVVWMTRSGSSTGGATMVGTVGAEVFCGLACEALSQND